MIREDTKDIDDEDKQALAGHRRSTYKAEEVNPILQNLLALEKTHFRPRTIVIVLVSFFSILFIGLARGTKSLKSIFGIHRCDPLDFILLAVQVIILLGLAAINIYLLDKEYKLKVENGYQFVKGDIVWNFKLIIFALVAGFLSGAVGLSGGILFTPLFLKFGIAPTVASSTSMYMAMFATLSSSILFMFSGYVIYPITFWLSAFAIIGTAAGVTIIGAAVKKSGRSSILVLLLAFVILISCISEGIAGTIKTISKYISSLPI